jgi:hypothetical protein
VPREIHGLKAFFALLGETLGLDRLGKQTFPDPSEREFSHDEPSDRTSPSFRDFLGNVCSHGSAHLSNGPY